MQDLPLLPAIKKSDTATVVLYGLNNNGCANIQQKKMNIMFLRSIKPHQQCYDKTNYKIQ